MQCVPVQCIARDVPNLEDAQIVRVGRNDDNARPIVLRFCDGHHLSPAERATSVPESAHTYQPWDALGGGRGRKRKVLRRSEKRNLQDSERRTNKKE